MLRQFGWIFALLHLLVGAALALSALRVCADPNNLPFSNRQEQGFENKIASLLAKDMNRVLDYDWHPQRRGYLRNTILAGRCDLIIGIATGVEMVETTQPYYRSTYVFVTRAASNFHLDSFDAPQLRKLRIGVQIIGDDYANTPPVHALARRGIVAIQGYRVLGDYQRSNPPASIIQAVSSGEIDVAIAWGPMAGYFAAIAPVELQIQPLRSTHDAALPLTFDISLGLRRGNFWLKQKVEAALKRNRQAILEILNSYHVPQLIER